MKFLKIDSKQHIESRLNTLKAELENFDWNHSVEIVWRKYQPVRSLNQNDLAEKWYRVIAQWCNDNGIGLTDPDTGEVTNMEQHHAKDMMKLYFIGGQTKVVANKEIVFYPETSKMKKGEFFNYMEKMLAWATDKGIALPVPEDSQFAKIRDGNI